MSNCLVSAIIPAFNEERTIGEVVRVLVGSGMFCEIIVIDDGSSDGTAEEARRAGVNIVVRLPRNSGKGAALSAGVARASSDVLCFLDADLLGLRPEHVRALVEPVSGSSADMCVGTVDRGAFLNAIALRLPAISGQRALRREFFNSVPESETKGFGVESSINRHAITRGMRVRRVVLHGVGNVRKTQKVGLARGLAQYAIMLADVWRGMVGS